MNRLAVAVFAVALGVSSLAFAQGHGHQGKPAVTGLARAESIANPNGVNNGIDKAEAKQSEKGKAGKSKRTKTEKQVSLTNRSVSATSSIFCAVSSAVACLDYIIKHLGLRVAGWVPLGERQEAKYSLLRTTPC